MTLPGLTVRESVAPMFNLGDKGASIAIIGTNKTDTKQGEIHTFTDYPHAFETFKTEEDKDDDLNPLLGAVFDIFRESEVQDLTQNLSVGSVHVINLGKEPNKDSYIKALNTLKEVKNVSLELLLGLSDVDILNSVVEHLKDLEKQGDYRIAIATTPRDAKIENMIAMTGKVGSSRVVLHSNPDMMPAFASKVACTPYYENPAKGRYRSKNTTDIKNVSRDDIEKLVKAGLVVDWESYDIMLQSRVAEPCMAISTSYATNPQPNDCMLHHRLNADHQARTIDNILLGFLKSNNTDIARHSAELLCRSHLQNEVRNGRLEDYKFNIKVDRGDPYTLLVDMRIRPVASIHYISMTRIIDMPAGTLAKEEA
jgi:hypothetical protein